MFNKITKKGDFMFNKIIMMLLIAIQFAVADVVVSERVQTFLDKKDRKGLVTYQSSANSLQEKKLGNVAVALEKRGIAFPNNGDKSYKDDEKSRYLAIDKFNGAVTYIDNKLDGLADQDRADTSKLRQIANGLLVEILGEESKQYRFINNAYEYIITKDDMKEKLNFITYRYVRVLDERLVLSSENYVLFTLGKNGTPSEIRVAAPNFLKEDNVKKGISVKSSSKYVERRIRDDIVPSYYRPVVNSNLKSIKISRATESFFPVTKGNRTFLIPHFSFVTELLFENGESFPQEIHIPVDIRYIENVNPNDILDL